MSPPSTSGGGASIPAGSRRPSSLRKRTAILDAAAVLFLRDGFATANMDELAERSGVSKQTVYSHFGSKENLFVEMVGAVTSIATERVHFEVPDPPSAAALAQYLEQYAIRQLTIVLDPRLVALRRLVIGEALRFPDLARTFWATGPGRAMKVMSERFGRFTKLGLLAASDPDIAAESFNWLIMAKPLNEAMMLGDQAIPDHGQIQRIAAEATRVFLAGYGIGAAGKKSMGGRSV